MINQPLLNYIKQQLSQNVGKDQIKNVLMSNGWDATDVEEGFNAVSLQFPPIPHAPSPVPTINPTIQSASNIINPVINPVVSPNLQSTPNFINPVVNQPVLVNQKKPNQGLKFIFIFLIILVLAGAGWFGYKYFSNSKINNQAEIPVINEGADKVAEQAQVPAFDMQDRTAKLNQVFEQLKAAKTVAQLQSIFSAESLNFSNQKGQSFSTSSGFSKDSLISITVDQDGQTGTARVNGPNLMDSNKGTQSFDLFFVWEKETWKLDFIKTLEITVPGIAVIFGAPTVPASPGEEDAIRALVVKISETKTGTEAKQYLSAASLEMASKDPTVLKSFDSPAAEGKMEYVSAQFSKYGNGALVSVAATNSKGEKITVKIVVVKENGEWKYDFPQSVVTLLFDAFSQIGTQKFITPITPTP